MCSRTPPPLWNLLEVYQLELSAHQTSRSFGDTIPDIFLPNEISFIRMKLQKISFQIGFWEGRGCIELVLAKWLNYRNKESGRVGWLSGNSGIGYRWKVSTPHFRGNLSRDTLTRNSKFIYRFCCIRMTVISLLFLC